jgi:hypothetical protein
MSHIRGHMSDTAFGNCPKQLIQNKKKRHTEETGRTGFGFKPVLGLT